MTRSWLLFPLICLICLFVTSSLAQDVPDGIVTGYDYKSVPIPTARYQVYLLGEFHGLQETKAFLLGYMKRLNVELGLQDVVLEEDQVYQQAARDYVEGKTTSIPPALCLRADVLDTIRKFNSSIPADQRVRVHLADIDSPMTAIRQHLLDLKERLGNRTIVIPDEEQALRERGCEIVQQMTALTTDQTCQLELETVRNSILANQQGIEIGTSLAGTRGNVVAEVREGTIARNILHVLKNSTKGAVLVFYGVTHVRKKDASFPVKDGEMFTYHPLALRLMDAGATVASIAFGPLSGKGSWRGATTTFPPQAEKYRFSAGESMEQLIDKMPTAKFFWVELAKHPNLHYADENLAEMYDFLVLINNVTPMHNPCEPGPR